MPSPDILLTPTNPISTSWKVEGLTCEGRAFVSVFFTTGIFVGDIEVLRPIIEKRGLSVATDWSCAGKALAQ